MILLTFCYIASTAIILIALWFLGVRIKRKEYYAIPLHIFPIVMGGFVLGLSIYMQQIFPENGATISVCTHEETKAVIIGEKMFNGHKVYDYKNEKKCLKESKFIFDRSGIAGHYYLVEK